MDIGEVSQRELDVTEGSKGAPVNTPLGPLGKVLQSRHCTLSEHRSRVMVEPI